VDVALGALEGLGDGAKEGTVVASTAPAVGDDVGVTVGKYVDSATKLTVLTTLLPLSAMYKADSSVEKVIPAGLSKLYGEISLYPFAEPPASVTTIPTETIAILISEIQALPIFLHQ
jgi:hypothetical protein